MADDAGEPPWPVVETETPGLHVLPWGEAPGGRENLAHRLGSVLSEGKRRYSFILLVCPGGLSSPYPAVLGSVADGAILALRAEHTPVRQITRTLRRWEGSGIRLFGFVIGKKGAVHSRAHRRHEEAGVAA